MDIIITNTNAITDKALNKELTSIKRAVEAGNKASWTVAQAFHHIVVDELFTTDFGSLGNLAQAIGVSKSVISRNVNGYAIASKLSLMHWTLASVIELLPICSKYPIEELNKICQHLQAEGVPSRNKVRDYVKTLLAQDTASAEEVESETETATVFEGTQESVNELEELRAEVERLKRVNSKLNIELHDTEGELAKERAHVERLSGQYDSMFDENTQLKAQLEEVNTVYQHNLELAMRALTTFKIGKSEILLSAKDIAQIVEDYLKEVEIDA